MAEINVADLPITPLSEFDESDSVLLINGGKAQQFTIANFKLWMLDNVQGDRGPEGPEGPAGNDGVSVTHSWTGTTLNITSASGTSSANLKGTDGTNGTNGEDGQDGTNGTNGWSPVLAVQNRGSDRVLQVISWVGGTGTIPVTGQYVGSTGLVPNIANAVNVRAEKGDTGSNGTDGEDGKSAYQLAVDEGFEGTLGEYLTSLVGDDGWSPILAGEEYQTGLYMKVIDWAGGTGNKPTSGVYIGATGFVATIAQAVNFRSVKGDNGWSPVFALEAVGQGVYLKVIDWVGGSGTKPTSLGYVSPTGLVSTVDTAINIKGPKGDTGTTVSEVEVATDGTITLTMSDASTVVSNTPTPPPVTTGYAKYIDTQYVGSTFFYVADGTTVSIPNNKGTVVETKLPTGVTTFYDGTLLQLDDEDGLYEVQVSFKLASHTSEGYIKVSFEDSTSAVLFEQDYKTRGDSFPDAVNITGKIVGSAAVAAGVTCKVRAYTLAYDMFDISYTVNKLI